MLSLYYQSLQLNHYPAGLWSTPSDLAKLAIEIALSQKGKANHVLSRSMAQEMLSVQTGSPTQFIFARKEQPARMGLGFFLGDETSPSLFGHRGDDAGFQAILIMDRATGEGAAIMTNSEFGMLLGDYLVQNIAREYGWKNDDPVDRPRAGAPAILMAIARSRGFQAALSQYQILKDAALLQATPDENTLLILGILLLADKRPEDALAALKLEVLEHPHYWNGFDTLAEVHLMLGEKQLAIQNYEKSFELNPENQKTLEKIRKLSEQA